VQRLIRDVQSEEVWVGQNSLQAGFPALIAKRDIGVVHCLWQHCVLASTLRRISSRIAMAKTCVLCLVAVAAASAQSFVEITKDASGVFWFTHNSNKFFLMGINHVNQGGQDDGVGNREAPQCKAATKSQLCGDSLNFCPVLAFAPYFNSTMAKYGSTEAWAAASISRVKSWGMNSIGGWSAQVAEEEAGRQSMYYAHLLDIGTTWLNHNGFDHDVFSQGFLTQAQQVVADAVVPRKNDPWLVGWQLDNEPKWDSLGLGPYLDRGLSAPGAQVAIAMLREEYGTVAALSKAWGVIVTSWDDVLNAANSSAINATAFGLDSDRFMAIAATQYFNTTTTLIRQADPNHLILGVRNAKIPTAIIEPTGRFVDVIDQHSYADDAPLAGLELLHNLTGKPVYVSEFSFTAIDSNLPNTIGARANMPYATQTDRGAGFLRYTDELAAVPYALGWHWWQYNDECSTGRWPDGEDSNYGAVSLADDEYTPLTDAFKIGTARQVAAHAASGTTGSAV
jgi:agarase